MPQIGKGIGTFLKVVCCVFLFWLLSHLIVTIFTDFLNDYNIFNVQDTPAVVTEKFSKKSMRGLPTYYVLVDLNGDGYNGIHNKVFASHFKRLEVGDTIKGHHIHGNHFFTTLDVVSDSFLFVCLLLVLLIFLAALIAWPIIAITAKRRNREKTTPIWKKKRRNKVLPKNVPEKGKYPWLKRILPRKVYQYVSDLMWEQALLYAFLAIALIFTSSFFVNGLQKISPLGKTKTEAIVVGKDSHSEINYYNRKVADPYFALELVFVDEHGKQYRVLKEVARSVFMKHNIGDPINISYITRNPYNIFVRNYSLFNLLETVNYVKHFYHSAILIGLLIFLALYYFSRKEKKKEKEKIDVRQANRQSIDTQ